jgi:hypothetical protein
MIIRWISEVPSRIVKLVEVRAGRQVISMSGDGGLAMLLGDLLTLRQLQLPVKTVVFNNGALSFVELEMKAAGIPTYGTDLLDPDFAGIATTAGVHGIRVEKAGDLEAALLEAFAHKGPALVEVRTSRAELSLPPKLTYGWSTSPRRWPPAHRCQAAAPRWCPSIRHSSRPSSTGSAKARGRRMVRLHGGGVRRPGARRGRARTCPA